MLALLIQLLEQTGGVLIVGQILPQVGGDVVMDVQTTLIHHFQGTQAGVTEAQAVFHGAVDVGEITDALFLDVQGFPQNGGLQAVGDKAQRVLFHVDGLFADAQGEVKHRVGGLLGGVIAPDDLDEGNDVGGVEPVHTTEPLFTGDTGADLGDRQTGGVGAQDGIRTGDGGGLLPELLLDVQIFQHRLHHQVAVGKALLVQGKGQAGNDFFGLLGCQVAGSHLAFLIDLHQLAATFQSGLGNVVQHHIAAIFGKDLGHGCAHGAGAGHYDFLNVIGVHRMISLRI